MHDVVAYHSDTSSVQRLHARRPRERGTAPREDDAEWEAVGRCEGREARRPSLCAWARLEPGDQPLPIDRGGGGDVLHVRFRHPPIPRAAEPKGAPPLRQRPFNTRPTFLERLARVRVASGPRCLQRLLLLPRMQREMTGHSFRPRTPGALCTRPAVLASKLHRALGTPVVGDLRGPRTRPLPLRTDPLGVLPVDRTLLQAIGPLHGEC
jgi:hypothetical protein